MSKEILCNVVDAGARYGLHPSWQPAQDLACFHLYETDPEEATRLSEKYAGSGNIAVHATALFSRDCSLTFHIRKHRALNSIYDTNRALLENDRYMAEEHAELGTYEVEAARIDSLYPDGGIHFLKLDTEGAELEILKGANSCLSDSVLGVRAEVPFAPILKDAPSFGDIHAFMLERGFELLNFDYDGRGSARSPFTRPERFGKIMSTDAVWIATRDRLFDGRAQDLRDNCIRQAYFLMLNNATDVALEILLLAVRDHGIGFGDLWQDRLFRDLHRRVALLFKEISYQPAMDSALLSTTYREIFDRDFPQLNQFYESRLFD